jgi:hypothetical protein
MKDLKVTAPVTVQPYSNKKKGVNGYFYQICLEDTNAT